ncbi:uncharacterized protein STEHIDRAFT_166337 [Stereum hirsutum FP-91666 SS1]|uniref:uncharacterized protein n=1 Tax=Stereum hirsutum (strain FP-91666) TaxID=721885 RepID=UPI000440B1C2|nr:uncharacterized protein STEHIDRAFT_166337 [Stereum hirsutum FP-91666 SS1]EIM90076.1 hypothetical protein STEHIDRAFT_166337 [Stereum hirsutum FP-91666 SS1]
MALPPQRPASAVVCATREDAQNNILFTTARISDALENFRYRSAHPDPEQAPYRAGLRSELVSCLAAVKPWEHCMIFPRLWLSAHNAILRQERQPADIKSISRYDPSVQSHPLYRRDRTPPGSRNVHHHSLGDNQWWRALGNRKDGVGRYRPNDPGLMLLDSDTSSCLDPDEQEQPLPIEIDLDSDGNNTDEDSGMGMSEDEPGRVLLHHIPQIPREPSPGGTVPVVGGPYSSPDLRLHQHRHHPPTSAELRGRTDSPSRKDYGAVRPSAGGQHRAPPPPTHAARPPLGVNTHDAHAHNNNGSGKRKSMDEPSPSRSYSAPRKTSRTSADIPLIPTNEKFSVYVRKCVRCSKRNLECVASDARPACQHCHLARSRCDPYGHRYYKNAPPLNTGDPYDETPEPESYEFAPPWEPPSGESFESHDPGFQPNGISISPHHHPKPPTTTHMHERETTMSAGSSSRSGSSTQGELSTVKTSVSPTVPITVTGESSVSPVAVSAPPHAHVHGPHVPLPSRKGKERATTLPTEGVPSSSSLSSAAAAAGPLIHRHSDASNRPSVGPPQRHRPSSDQIPPPPWENLERERAKRTSDGSTTATPATWTTTATPATSTTMKPPRSRVGDHIPVSPVFSVSSDSDIPLSWQVALQGAQTAGGSSSSPSAPNATQVASADSQPQVYPHPATAPLGRLQPVDLSIFNRNLPSGSGSSSATTITPQDPTPTGHHHLSPTSVSPHTSTTLTSRALTTTSTATVAPGPSTTTTSSTDPNSSGLLQLLLTQFVTLEERMEATQEEMRNVREEMRSTKAGILKVLKDTSGDMREMASIAVRAAERIDVSLGKVRGAGGGGGAGSDI